MHIDASRLPDDVYLGMDSGANTANHYVSVRAFSDGFDVKDGSRVDQFEGKLADFAVLWGDALTWFELKNFRG